MSLCLLVRINSDPYSEILTKLQNCQHDILVRGVCFGWDILDRALYIPGLYRQPSAFYKIEEYYLRNPPNR
jgi:hypothetical protein